MATPALRALRAAQPGAEITVEAPPHLEGLLQGLASFDRFLPDASRGAGSSLGRARALRHHDFDWAVLLPDSQRAALGPLDRVAEREGRKRAELDGRLDKMIQRPVAYSRQFASLTTIEQEIWLRALAEFALETNRAGEAIRGLRSSASPVTLELATAFEAELRRMQAEQRPRMAPALESR